MTRDEPGALPRGSRSGEAGASVVYDGPVTFRRAARPLLLATLLLAAWAACHGVAADLDTVWLSLVPFFALVLALVSGRYVGEGTIARLASARRAAPRRVVGARARVARRRPAAHHRGGGLLLARRLAGRAPPRGVLAAA
jgi:hypothetical protein